MPPLLPAESTLDAELLGGWPLRHEGGDKAVRGTVLVIGGSNETPGAVILAGIAALRMGAGRLQIATAEAIAPAVAVAVPEALVTGLDDIDAVAERAALAQAVVVGPGLMDPAVTRRLLVAVIASVPATTTVVIDAGALDALVDLDRVETPERCVLTPNRDELATLLEGADSSHPERDVAARFAATVASFGRVTTADGTEWVDDVDVDGLGTSGSGDVLAGAVAGAAARCGDPVRAACWGIYAHRSSATRLSERIGPTGYLARELADELASAIAAVAAGG